MARTNHVFIASGDACGICESLSGMVVEEGFRPHDNCNCNTAVNDDGDGECEYDYDVSDTFPSGPRTRANVSLTITCPDGTVYPLGDFITIDLQEMIDGEGANDELLEDLAGDQCEKLCSEEPPFLCC
jgi:hypothetical protein